MTAPKPKHDSKTPKGVSAIAKLKTDWEAVERDYRSTNMTLRELGAKYGVTHSAIAHKVKKLGWTQDLTRAVKQATNALLVEEAVTTAVNKSTQTVTNTVLAVAELNKQVILSHRSRLTDLADAVDFAKGVLLKVGSSIADIREAATLVQAVNGLASATKVLIDKEREAFSLNDDKDKTPEKDASRYTDTERAVKLSYLLAKAEGRA